MEFVIVGVIVEVEEVEVKVEEDDGLPVDVDVDDSGVDVVDDVDIEVDVVDVVEVVDAVDVEDVSLTNINRQSYKSIYDRCSVVSNLRSSLPDTLEIEHKKNNIHVRTVSSRVSVGPDKCIRVTPSCSTLRIL